MNRGPTDYESIEAPRLIAFHPEQGPNPAELLAVLSGRQLPEPRATSVKVLILMLAREDEVADMPSAELDGSLWRLPAERQGGYPESVRVTGRGATDRLFQRGQAELDAAILEAAQEIDPEAKPLPHWRFHDLRRAGSSWIDEEFGGEVMHAARGHSLGDRLAKDLCARLGLSTQEADAGAASMG